MLFLIEAENFEKGIVYQNFLQNVKLSAALINNLANL
jgi:hypothetical protein